MLPPHFSTNVGLLGLSVVSLGPKTLYLWAENPVINILPRPLLGHKRPFSAMA